MTTTSYQPPGNTCPVLRTNGRRGCLNCLTNAVLTPDGLDLYVVDESTSTLMDVRRDPATGEIAQALGAAGCVSGGGLGGCTPARGIVGARRKRGQPALPALPALRAVAFSPDGANVYAAARPGYGPRPPRPCSPFAAIRRPARSRSSPAKRGASARR